MAKTEQCKAREITGFTVKKSIDREGIRISPAGDYSARTTPRTLGRLGEIRHL